MSNAVNQYIEAHLNDSVAELSRLCAQPSVSAQGLGIKECAELVADLLRQRGFRADVRPTSGHPVVVGELKGKSAKTLIFYCHYDVQPPEPLELWKSPPFTPTIRDGKLFARGVADDKSHIVSRLAAIDAVQAVSGELPCTIKFVIEGEEEIGSPSLPQFIEQNKKELRADACIWEAGGVNFREQPTMTLGMRGICYVELSLECLTQDVHSGLGGSILQNAAWRLVWALGTLKDAHERIRIPGFYADVKKPTALDMKLLRKMPDNSKDLKKRYGAKKFLKNMKPGVELRREAVFVPTCTICGITTGYQGPGTKTVLPARASAKIDFRLVPNQDPEDIVRKLRKHLKAQDFGDVQVKAYSQEKPGQTDPAHPFIALVADAAREVFGQEMQIQPMVGGSGPNHAFLHYLKVPIGNTCIGYPGAGAHAPNENMRLDLFVKGTQHTARIIQKFAES